MVYNWSYDDGPRVNTSRVDMFEQKQGDLIEMALRGEFDVITHGCNCYCNMGAGIAVKMKEVFGANHFKLEGSSYKGSYNKLGQIDYQRYVVQDGHILPSLQAEISGSPKQLYIVNSYTQYAPGIPNTQYGIPLDYDALRLCLRKINREFKGLHVGMPRIGCGLAKGDWKRVSGIITDELGDCRVTVVTL